MAVSRIRRGSFYVFIGEWIQRGVVGEDFRFFVDVGDFYFGCVGDFGIILNSVFISIVNK